MTSPLVGVFGELPLCASCARLFADRAAVEAMLARGAYFHPFSEPAPTACPSCSEARSRRRLLLGKESLEGFHCEGCGLFEAPYARSRKKRERSRPPDREANPTDSSESWFASREEVDERHRILAFFFGFPLELSTRVSRWPPATTSLFWLCILTTFVGLIMPPVGSALALWAGEITPETAFQLLTSIFLHGDLLHLAGNLYFLVAFARLPETWIGSARLALVFFSAEIAAGLFFLFFHQGENTIMVGASGGISAILALYMVLFPTHRVGLSLLVAVLRVPAFLYIGFWIYFQLLSFGGDRGSGVSYASHLLGIAVGLAWGLRERRRAREESTVA